jgi:hypothetical protein
MKVQRVRASEKIVADQNKVTLRYGPPMYNIETVDRDITKPFEHRLGADYLSRLGRRWWRGVTSPRSLTHGGADVVQAGPDPPG